ncbi:hypothetical protein ACFSX5_13600 [Devosia albogilva]|uniref:Uncharacterized protein n=1 Tax=Devosia albogilva TaxID=429726 RepID=A0ABW5QN39_9HYPH
MASAGAEGYRINMAFVVLGSPEMHLARVRTRVASAGDDIPAETILRRYDRALNNLPAAIRLADQVIIFDNTDKAADALCPIDGRRIAFSGLDDDDELQVRLADLVGAGLDLPRSSRLSAVRQGS